MRTTLYIHVCIYISEFVHEVSIYSENYTCVCEQLARSSSLYTCVCVNCTLIIYVYISKENYMCEQSVYICKYVWIDASI